MDILLEDDEKIAVEITMSKVDAKYIDEVVRIWGADKYWFISYRGFTKSAVDLARSLQNMILTTAKNIERLIPTFL